MAEQKSIALAPSTVGSEQPAARAGGLTNKVKILVFVLLVILIECVVAWLLIPSKAQTAAMVQAQLATSGDELLLADGLVEMANGVEAEKREVDLGEFSVTAYQPLSGTSLQIDFHLYGTVLAEHEKEILALLAENQHRFREQVLVILRSAEMADLTDAGLGLIKRKILEKTNRILGKVLLQQVIFSDFSFIEQ